MKISERTILEHSFSNSFVFMLNRLGDAGLLKGDHFEWPEATKVYVQERCFDEFMLALEELGITLGEVEIRRSQALQPNPTHCFDPRDPIIVRELICAS